MSNDETLLGVSEKVKNFCVIYTCDISKVPDFTKVSSRLVHRLYTLRYARRDGGATLEWNLTRFSLLQMYELYDPVTTMFFYRNKHIMVDLGTGNSESNVPSDENLRLIILVFQTTRSIGRLRISRRSVDLHAFISRIWRAVRLRDSTI